MKNDKEIVGTLLGFDDYLVPGGDGPEISIKKCKDFYEVLDVKKDCKESDTKKAYRKLALQMHPDKNKAPGATEAFKAIGNAYAVLSDAEKRRKYDVYGPELQQQSSQSQSDYTHGGSEGDITPEELFNMFFGGGFPSGNGNRRSHNHQRSHFYSFSSGGDRQSENVEPLSDWG
ncbi:DnaJ subfamily B member 14 [Nucella lapillus]